MLRALARLSHPTFVFVTLLAVQAANAQTPTATLHTLTYAPGQTITLTLPQGFDINLAATGLKRVRFLTQSPDGRIFATSMYNLADNTNGAIYILQGWDPQAHRFTRITPYLTHLRNPNNLAFYAEPAHGAQPATVWLYVSLTDRLLRFRYTPGDEAPRAAPEVLAHWPDYGLNYKYGGWHLTRTVAVATLHGATRVYVALGSSCNYCQEHEVSRASVVSMNPDGTDQRIVAHGLRNAVDLRFISGLDGGALFATDMGDDHLGDQRPEDTFFELDANTHPGPIAAPRPPNFGWPTCYFDRGVAVHDTTPLPDLPQPVDPHAVADRPAATHPATDSVYGRQKNISAAGTNLTAGGGHAPATDPNAALGKPPAPLAECSHVPAAYTTFAAHSSPLGMAYFDAHSPLLSGNFLIALHGAGHPHIGTGYRLVRLTPSDRKPHDWMTGFLTGAPGSPKVHGRPCGLLITGPDSFLLTDDNLGLVYFVHPASH